MRPDCYRKPVEYFFHIQHDIWDAVGIWIFSSHAGEARCETQAVFGIFKIQTVFVQGTQGVLGKFGLKQIVFSDGSQSYLPEAML